MTTPENAVETEVSRVIENEPRVCSPRYNNPYPGSHIELFSPPPYREPSSSCDDPNAENYRFYQPYSYYYPQYDNQICGDHANRLFQSDHDVKPIEGAPDIIITKSMDDYENIGKDSNPVDSLNDFHKYKSKDPENHTLNQEITKNKFSRPESPFDILARRLIEMTSPVYDEEASAKVLKSLKSIHDDDDLKLPDRLSPKPEENQGRDSEDDSDDMSINSSSSDEDDENKIHSSKERLQAIKSVTDIRVYDKDCEEQDSKRNRSNTEYWKTTKAGVQIFVSRESEDGFVDKSYDEDEEEEEEEGIVNSGSDTDDDTNDNEFNGDVEIRDQLSVIYEEESSASAENYRKRRTESINSTSSTLSECSTTIANDEQSEEEEEDDEDKTDEPGDYDDADGDNEEEENSVTVRLPLRLSFSRSSNDENITTVVVGDSEIRDSRRSSLKTLDSDNDLTTALKVSQSEIEANHKDYEEDNDDADDHANDVSVTFSLTSRSNSIDRSGLLSKTSSVDHETSTKDWDDSDSESVSISVSLPMKRNKFITQTLNNDNVTNDIHAMKSNWDQNEPEVDENENETIQDYLPTTIAEIENMEEEDESIEEQEEDSEDENEDRKTIEYLDDEQEDIKADLSMTDDPPPSSHIDENSHKEFTINITFRKSERSSRAESPRRNSGIFDALRELRAWSETREKRATVERELEKQKVEQPKLIMDLSFDNIDDFREKYYGKQNQNSEENNREDSGSESKDSSSDDTSSESEEQLVDLTNRETPTLNFGMNYKPQSNLNKPKEDQHKELFSIWDQPKNSISVWNEPADRQQPSPLSIWDQPEENPQHQSFSIWERPEEPKHPVAISAWAQQNDDQRQRTRSIWAESRNLRQPESISVWAPPNEMRHHDSDDDHDKLSVDTLGTSPEFLEPTPAKKPNPLEESLSFILEETRQKCEESLKRYDRPDEESLKSYDRPDDKAKLTVREKIAAFETGSLDTFERSKTPKPILEITTNNTTVKKEVLSRNSSVQRSESEQDEDDSGVTSDMSKPVSENDTDPECFPELRKMSRYQRVNTHSRLFKLLQEEIGGIEDEKKKSIEEEKPKVVLRPKKKIVHNVSIMRKSNPDALKDAETMFQRRERLSLPLKLSNSIDADNPSTSNSPSSPAPQNDGISEELISELIQSLLLKTDSLQLRNIPWAKLQEMAKKVLQEDLDMDSLENTSIESTPALTPQDSKREYQKSYADYYESWNRSCSPRTLADSALDSTPSPILRNLQNQSPIVFRPVRCPRVLSSKTVNRDLSRLAESRESESPETYNSSPRSSATPERSREYLRATSLSRIGKV